MAEGQDTQGKNVSPSAQFRALSEVDSLLLERLVMDRTQPRNAKSEVRNLDLTPIAKVFRRTSRETSDIRNIFQTMPDLKLQREILVSAICSPGDLSKSDLIFGNELKGVESALTAPLDKELEDFFIGEQKLNSKVPNWVDDALIWSGAHPILVIPEASLDKIILGGVNTASMEAVASYGGEFANGWYRPKGVLGLRVPTTSSGDYVSFESANGRVSPQNMLEYHTIKGVADKKQFNLPIRVTDNLAVLRAPAVQQLKRTRGLEGAYGVPAFESKRRERRARAGGDGKTPSNAEVYNKFFKRPQNASRSRLEVIPTTKQTGGQNVGHPLVYHLASEAVMPVCVPGDESNHVGYIVILDQNGFPVSYTRRLNFYDDIRQVGQGNGASSQASGEILNMAKEAIAGNVANASNADIDRLTDIHALMIEQDLIARLKSGLMGGDFEISMNEHINRLMLTRTFKNQLTTLLYVPAELMIYMAYEYNEFGIGKSILEDAKALAAMRAAVSVANVIGATKNAIPGKDINIELDPDDGTPIETATFMANEALGLAYHHFPMGISSTVGLAEQLQISSLSVNVTGNPRYPEVKTSITPRESSRAEIDTQLQQSLRDDMTRVFSLTPEMVDNLNQPDFATTLVSNNLMLLKRVMIYQGITNPFITDYVRVFTYNSGVLVDKLLGIIEQNKKFLPDEFKEAPEDFLEEYLNKLFVKLPEPETDNLNKQLETFKSMNANLDEVLPMFIREEYFDGFSADEIKDALPTVVAAWKGVIMRDWLRKRGILRELDVFTTAEDGSPVMDLAEEMSSHVDAVMKSIQAYAQKVAKDALKRKALNKGTMEDIEKAKNAMTPEEEPATTDDGLDTPPDETDNGFDENAGSEEPTDNAEEETPPEEEENTQEEETPEEAPEEEETPEEENTTDETEKPEEEGEEEESEEEGKKPGTEGKLPGE